jgi:anti-anti-sigma factor
MAPVTCVIRYSEHDRTLTFRVEGRATMAHGLPVRRAGERAIAAGTSRIHFDLRDCTYMDSTMLGTLLTLKKALDRAGGQLTLVAPSPACARILYQTGLTDMLTASAAEPEPAGPWIDLATGADDAASFKRNVIQAHQELAALPGKPGEEFTQVVRTIEQAENQPPRGVAD